MKKPMTVLDYSNLFSVSVGVITKRDDKYLLIQENDSHGRSWNFPSGKVNVKEALTDAAIRECLEETGYTVKIKGIVSFYYYTTHKNSKDKKKDRRTLRVNFQGEIDQRIQQVSPKEENIKVSWVTKEKIKDIEKKHKFRNWVASKTAEDALGNKTYPLSIFTEK